VSAEKPVASLANRAVDEALRTIGALFGPGEVIEIRALGVGRNLDHAGNTYSGYFPLENSAEISAAIRSVDGKAEGVYIVLNPFNPDLLTRSNNRLRVKPKNTTSDRDITEWRWLYIDADAVRPGGISATDAEHEAADEMIARGSVTATVRIAGITGEAHESSQARAITFAIARAFGIDPEVDRR
jgi:hypothetical protein